MDRRRFLRGAGLVSAGAVVGGGAVTAASADRELTVLRTSGHAVGVGRPPGLRSISVTYRVPTTAPIVALTFDDGPSPRYTAAVLDILDRTGVTATFNVIGEHVRQHPELLRRAAAAGHEIGNHTWSHPDLSLADAGTAHRELTRGANEIAAVIGSRPQVFRPPLGYFSGATVMMAASLNYPIVLWDQLFDRHGPSGSANAQRIAAAAEPGSIILGHDGGSRSCDVVVAGLPELIDRLQQRGFAFVTTSALLAELAPPTIADTPARS